MLNRPLSSLALLALLPVSFASGCGPDNVLPLYGPLESQASVDFSNLRAFSVDGVTLDEETGNLHVFLGGQGILITDADGATLDAIPVQGETVFDNGLTDLALLPGNRYALQTWDRISVVDQETLELDSEVSTLGDYDPQSGWSSSMAVTWDAEREVLLSATSLFNWDLAGEQTSAEIATFALDGERVDTALLTVPEFLPEGLARHPTQDVLIAVDDERILTFDLEGKVLNGGIMPDVQDGTGLAIDEQQGLLWVTDRSDMEMHAYPLNAFVPST